MASVETAYHARPQGVAQSPHSGHETGASFVTESEATAYQDGISHDASSLPIAKSLSRRTTQPSDMGNDKTSSNDIAGQGPTDDFNNDELGAQPTSAQRVLRWLVLGPGARRKDLEMSHATSQHTGDRRQIKNYQKFTGNSRFLFGGRMMSSKGKPLNVTVLSIILISGGLFFGFMYVVTRGPFMFLGSDG